jgi:hypothetical protein
VLACRLEEVNRFFIGHGGFAGVSQDYYLAIRRTRRNSLRASGVPMRSLAETITEQAGKLRRFLILDCCFAGSAFTTFQGDPSQGAIRQTLDAFRVNSKKKTHGIPEKGSVNISAADAVAEAARERISTDISVLQGFNELLGVEEETAAIEREVMGHPKEEILTQPKTQEQIGPSDAVSNIFPDIDLTPHGGVKGGVSRLHALCSPGYKRGPGRGTSSTLYVVFKPQADFI